MRLILVGSVCLLGLIGCSEESGNVTREPPQESQAGPPPPAVFQQAEVTTAPGSGQQVAEGSPQDIAATERVEAKVGAGVKGRSLEKEGAARLMTVPAIAYFRTKQRVVFEIQIPHALQLYEALHGKKPVTEREFFEQIVQGQHMKLPELPEGHKYRYDPETGKLMVQRPAK